MITQRDPKVGDTFKSRTGKSYMVVKAEKGGFTIVRLDSSKPSTVKISAGILRSTLERVRVGETFHTQANKPGGGISYTVAITSGVVWALHLKLNSEGRFQGDPSIKQFGGE
tara:strand:+ start:1206 stop:1541 length:336 start_codon:yes stop_codon:yes gene_type:complete